MYEDIKKILDYAIWAPSGDNSQPWRFEVTENEISVFNIPERDTSLYNYKQNASLVALGGLIENIKIAADHFGYKTGLLLLPEGADIANNLIATISLARTQQSIIYNDLYKYIKERSSNRKIYGIKPLADEHKKVLLFGLQGFNGVSVKLEDARKNVEALAEAASVNEKVVLENKKLHEFLFHRITWNEREDKQKRGFFIKTLELKGPQVAAFRLFRFWLILKLFNLIGASNLVSHDNAKLYKESGALVAIIANDTSASSFLKSGMLMQRFWLTATKLGLSVQPVTGVLFLHHRIKANGGELHKDHGALIENAYSEIENIFEANGQPITMMFRVGYADKPTAKCLRHEPEIKLLN